jgi:hypothetical protein
MMVGLAACVLHTNAAVAQAAQEDIKCGPPSWRNPICKVCKEGGKSYVVSKFVEGAISIVLESIKAPNSSKPVADAISTVIGAKAVSAKRYQEGGVANPETTDTYCWKPVKAEEIKPLKTKSYLLGTFYDGHCTVEAGTCYHVTMECRKDRDANVFSCVPKLQEFKATNGKCVNSPTATTCDCKPNAYFKCGLGAVKGPATRGGKAGGMRR